MRMNRPRVLVGRSLRWRAEAGRTLIELIIAMAIGLVIVAGVASLYLSSSQVSRVASQVGATEDGGQLALFVVGDAIRMAGFGEIVGSSATSAMGQTQFEGPQIAACTSGTFAAPWATPPNLICVPNATGTDQLWVAFQSDNVKASPQSALSDCLGQAFVLANVDHHTTINRFGGPSVTDVPVAQNVFGIDGATGAFACTGKFGPVVGVGAPLVSNTENFKVFFGFDNVRYAAGANGPIDLVPMARQWLDASAINLLPPGPAIVGSPAASPWDYVVSVLVCVTVVTNETGLTAQAATTRARCPNTFAEVEAGGPLTVVDNDGFIRRTFSQVFAVRANAGKFAAFN